MVSSPHWLTPTAAFSAQMQTWTVGIWIVLASATTYFGNQKASHNISCYQPWSMIEWSISSACYGTQASGALNISSRVMQCGSRGKHSVSKVLEILGKVRRQGEHIYGLAGFAWSGNIILAAIQPGGSWLSIIQATWFVDRTLKFITKTTKSMPWSLISLVCPCTRSCSPQWGRWVGVLGQCTVHVRYECNIKWQPYNRQWASEGLVRVKNTPHDELNADAVYL